jgi:hypothetical protein
MKADLDEVIDAVKVWLSLSNNNRWLIIYNNYDNLKVAGDMDPALVDIRKFIPEVYHDSVTIISKYRSSCASKSWRMYTIACQILSDMSVLTTFSVKGSAHLINRSISSFASHSQKSFRILPTPWR